MGALAVRYRRRSHDRTTDRVVGSLVAFSLGTAAGLVVGELIGGIDQERIRRGLRRLGRRARLETGPDPRAVEQAAIDALQADPDARTAHLTVRALGNGTVELIGWVTSERARRRAERLTLRVPGVRTVINRVLVRGLDDHPPDDDESESL